MKRKQSVKRSALKKLSQAESVNERERVSEPYVEVPLAF